VNRISVIARMAVAIFALLFSLAPSLALELPSVNDTARFLAGMKPSADSPLARLTKEGGWVRHARTMDAAWKRIETRQLSKIRAWSKENVPGTRKQMLYMFSGPDFLYANAFFPDAEIYVLSALEPVGPIPNMARHSPGARSGALHELRGSMQTVLNYSFFITKHMKSELRSGNMRGTLPVLFVFLARSGHTIDEVEYVFLNTDGLVVPKNAALKGNSPGVRVAFTSKGGKAKTLYYFRTDLSNGGLKKSGFRAFSQGLGPADALVKSASYLLHSGNFTVARDFLLKQSDVLIQDPSGIPLRHIPKDAWEFHPFGHYVGAISIFKGRYQRDLKQLFSKKRAKPIKFGIGYRWHLNETSVLLAIKKKP
jgi:hypothetical protein